MCGVLTCDRSWSSSLVYVHICSASKQFNRWPGYHQEECYGLDQFRVQGERAFLIGLGFWILLGSHLLLGRLSYQYNQENDPLKIRSYIFHMLLCRHVLILFTPLSTCFIVVYIPVTCSFTLIYNVFAHTIYMFNQQDRILDNLSEMLWTSCVWLLCAGVDIWLMSWCLDKS